MAFLRSLPQCSEFGCSRAAAEELLTFRNDLYGSYCKSHAATRLRRLLKEEEAYFKAERERNDHG